MAETKDDIQRRLVRAAATQWGVAAVDMPSLDPVVELLFTACSYEFERIYQELGQQQARMLERIARLLLPEADRGAKPAFAMATAQPASHTGELETGHKLLFKSGTRGRGGSVPEEVYFTPVHKIKLLGLKQMQLLAGRSIYQYRDGNPLAREAVGTLPQPLGQSVWLGLAAEPTLAHADGLTLFIDWPNGERSQLYDLLQGLSLEGPEGPIAYKSGQRIAVAENVFEASPLASQAELALNFFGHQWLHLGETGALSSGLVPPGLDKQLTKETAPGLKQPLWWLGLRFARPLPEAFLQDAVFSVNAFPVLDRRPEQQTYRLQGGFNIIPLNCGNAHFLSVTSITSDQGNTYLPPNAQQNSRQIAEGQYYLRSQGVERFDPRTARQMLERVMILLREESATFQAYGLEALSDQIKTLNQLINALEAKVTAARIERGRFTYVFLKPRTAGETLYIQYLTTRGITAMELRAGAVGVPHQEATLQASKAYLLTAPLAGRDPLADTDALDAFKAALLTRHRIVSEADVRLLCVGESNNLVEDVAVKPIFRPVAGAKGGFERCLKVDLILSVEGRANAAASQNLQGLLEARLNQSSSLLTPFVVGLQAN